MYNTLLRPTVEWIQNDYHAHRIRFIMELVAWVISVGCAIVMAGTVPDPPLMALYPSWITGCSIYAWCAYSRRSFGMLTNYILLVTIDLTGLIRMIL